VYSKLVAEGYDILSIHISSKLSATLDSATMAAREFPKARIELVDTLLTSMAMGFPVIEAARAAREGATLEECKRIVELCLPLCGAIFIPKTLEFLHRGGRIGGAAAFLGSALDLKPILHLVNGKIEPAQRVRTMGKAIDRMLDMFAERIGKNTPIHVAALHANAHDQAGIILEKVRQRYDVADIKDAVYSEVSPVLGTHTGPGTVGIGYMAGK
jgi:DegV family protein with EDD domain